MAQIDFPLSKLKTYKGINPKPKDFDRFWNKSVQQLDDINPDVKIQPADFKTDFADCFDLWFTSTKGARIYAKLIKPKNIKGKAPAVLKFHGYSGNSGDWTDSLVYAAEGFVTAAMDCRGQGGLSEDSGGVKGTTKSGHIIRGLEDKSENLLFRDIFLDTVQLARIVMGFEEVDSERMTAFGRSQGGALTLACAALVPQIKKLAPQFPFLSDYKRVWELDFETGAYLELRDFFRRRDPLHEKEEDIFTKLGYIDVHHLAEKIKGSVLMAVSLRDDVCPPSTQFAAYNNINSEKKILLYKDFNHENLPLFADKTFEFLRDI
jgi:cephalosporin-C deacetylase